MLSNASQNCREEEDYCVFAPKPQYNTIHAYFHLEIGLEEQASTRLKPDNLTVL